MNTIIENQIPLCSKFPLVRRSAWYRYNFFGHPVERWQLNAHCEKVFLADDLRWGKVVVSRRQCVAFVMLDLDGGRQ